MIYIFSKIPFPEHEREINAKQKIDTNLYDVIEGDIVVPKVKNEKQLRNTWLNREKRKIIKEFSSETGKRTRWPMKTVPYEMDKGMCK